jgi:hypothetical protein
MDIRVPRDTTTVILGVCIFTHAGHASHVMLPTESNTLGQVGIFHAGTVSLS